jgi:hypothetical protein
MKHIKRFNESVEDSQVSDYNPSKGRGHSYKENLGRANNEEVYKILPELENTVGKDIEVLVSKLEEQIKSGKIKDTDTRNIAVAIGHIAYEKMN